MHSDVSLCARRFLIVALIVALQLSGWIASNHLWLLMSVRTWHNKMISMQRRRGILDGHRLMNPEFADHYSRRGSHRGPCSFRNQHPNSSRLVNNQEEAANSLRGIADRAAAQCTSTIRIVLEHSTMYARRWDLVGSGSLSNTLHHHALNSLKFYIPTQNFKINVSSDASSSIHRQKRLIHCMHAPKVRNFQFQPNLPIIKIRKSANGYIYKK